jgi:sRNA-binding carbon storage regulator CsrA
LFLLEPARELPFIILRRKIYNEIKKEQAQQGLYTHKTKKKGLQKCHVKVKPGR